MEWLFGQWENAHVLVNLCTFMRNSLWWSMLWAVSIKSRERKFQRLTLGEKERERWHFSGFREFWSLIEKRNFWKGLALEVLLCSSQKCLALFLCLDAMLEVSFSCQCVIWTIKELRQEYNGLQYISVSNELLGPLPPGFPDCRLFRRFECKLLWEIWGFRWCLVIMKTADHLEIPKRKWWIMRFPGETLNKH